MVFISLSLILFIIHVYVLHLQLCYILFFFRLIVTCFLFVVLLHLLLILVKYVFILLLSQYICYPFQFYYFVQVVYCCVSVFLYISLHVAHFMGGLVSFILFTLFSFSPSYICTQVRCGIERWHYRFSIGCMFFIYFSFLVLSSPCLFLLLYYSYILISLGGNTFQLLLGLFMDYSFRLVSIYILFYFIHLYFVIYVIIYIFIIFLYCLSLGRGGYPQWLVTIWWQQSLTLGSAPGLNTAGQYSTIGLFCTYYIVYITSQTYFWMYILYYHLFCTGLPSSDQVILIVIIHQISLSL